jgi:hypothetical protein
MASFFKDRLSHHPNGIHPAKIRQIIATAGESCDLNEQEEGYLAHSMLHSIDVHRQFYTKASWKDSFSKGRAVLKKIINATRKKHKLNLDVSNGAQQKEEITKQINN